MDYTCCFTGHRPDKLYGYNLNKEGYSLLFNRLKDLVEDLIKTKNINTFIVGGALGFDTLSFLVVHSLKSSYDIKVKVAIPFRNQYIKWTNEDKMLYKEMLALADEVIEVDKEEGYKINGIEPEIYHRVKMNNRNKYMIDNSKYVIGCWDGSKGGTYNALAYTKANGNKELILIKP